MARNYENQTVIQLLGTKSIKPPTIEVDGSMVITPVALTAAYAGNVSKAAYSRGNTKQTYDVYYTAGTNATELDLKLEFSNDVTFLSGIPINWFQEVTEATAAGVTTETATTRKFNNGGTLVAGTIYKFRFTIDVSDLFTRISAQEVLSSGTTFGSIYVEVVNSGR